MFGFGKPKLEVGKLYYYPKDNPFDTIWVARITDIKTGNHSNQKYIKYVSWQAGSESMPRIEQAIPERDFRFFYPKAYIQ